MKTIACKFFDIKKYKKNTNIRKRILRRDAIDIDHRRYGHTCSFIIKRIYNEYDTIYIFAVCHTRCILDRRKNSEKKHAAGRRATRKH